MMYSRGSAEIKCSVRGTGSGVPESTPAGFCVFLLDPESKIYEKTYPDPESILAVAGVCVVIS